MVHGRHLYLVVMMMMMLRSVVNTMKDKGSRVLFPYEHEYWYDVVIVLFPGRPSFIDDH